MIYETISSNQQLPVSQILFVQTFGYEEEYAPPQSGPAEGFWELLYAEEGIAAVSAPAYTHTLAKTELCFRHPSEKFQIRIQAPAPAKFISVGFTCPDASISAMERFRNKVLPTGAPERRLLHQIVTEISSLRGIAPFAAGQAALLCLQMLLILLRRNSDTDITSVPALRRGQLREEKDLFLDILDYMEAHISDHLTISQICRDKLIGRTFLQKLFAEYTGCGIIDYFSLMKINAAKQLIRQGDLNFTQIAEYLGYNSIHYFSRQFKVITGITPSEYAESLPDRQSL